jgi:GntR family transcriptional regulator/MocR family aminotransferase
MPIPPQAIRLDAAPAGTLQERIRQVVAGAIRDGRFRAGERMPSSRALAAHLGVARITVSLAYAELVAADWLTASGRSGHYVSPSAPRAQAFAQAPDRAPRVDYAARAARRFLPPRAPERPADWDRYPFPFVYGQADPTLFDHANWRACALKALGKADFEELARDWYAEDDPQLLDALCRIILPRRGIAARPGEVLVTLGAQNALWIAAQVLLGPGRRAAVEVPGYPALRAILAQTGAAMADVAVDALGLPPEAVPPGTDVVFTTASHQCPTGATMPLARREALLARAAAGDFVVVEDDYEFELRFREAVQPSLKSLDREGRVIHVGSFSKSLFPGLRLGYLAAPEGFIAQARALRATLLRHPPGHGQRTAAWFITLGHYDALVLRMQAAYRRRRALVIEGLEGSGLALAGPAEAGGSSLWLKAPIPAAVLARKLQAEGVLVEAGDAFFPEGSGAGPFLRLAYSSIPAARIPEGMARVAAVVSDSAKTSPRPHPSASA